MRWMLSPSGMGQRQYFGQGARHQYFRQCGSRIGVEAASASGSASTSSGSSSGSSGSGASGASSTASKSGPWCLRQKTPPDHQVDHEAGEAAASPRLQAARAARAEARPRRLGADHQAAVIGASGPGEQHACQRRLGRRDAVDLLDLQLAAARPGRHARQPDRRAGSIVSLGRSVAIGAPWAPATPRARRRPGSRSRRPGAPGEPRDRAGQARARRCPRAGRIGRGQHVDPLGFTARRLAQPVDRPRPRELRAAGSRRSSRGAPCGVLHRPQRRPPRTRRAGRRPWRPAGDPQQRAAPWPVHAPARSASPAAPAMRPATTAAERRVRVDPAAGRLRASAAARTCRWYGAGPPGPTAPRRSARAARHPLARAAPPAAPPLLATACSIATRNDAPLRARWSMIASCGPVRCGIGCGSGASARARSRRSRITRPSRAPSISAPTHTSSPAAPSSSSIRGW